MTDRTTLISLLCFRLLNGLLLRSTFQPDEEWQSSEVAHTLVFGYGFLTWEWEKCIALRSVAHPAVFAMLFWILKQFHLDFPEVIALAPRVLQSFLAGLTDYGVVQLAKVWYEGDVAADPEAEDARTPAILRSEGGKSVSQIQCHRGKKELTAGSGASNLKGKDLTADSPPSADNEQQARLRNAAGAGRIQTAFIGGLHWISEYRHAEAVGDVTKGASLVSCITLCTLLSWFNFFCLPRTYSSCLETFLNVYALLFFARGRSVAKRESHQSGMICRSARVTTNKAVYTSTLSEPSSIPSTYEVSGGQEKHSRGKYLQKGEVLSGTNTNGLVSSYSLQCSSTFYILSALSCAALSVIVRPPAVIFWVIFCSCKILQHLKGIDTRLADNAGYEYWNRRTKEVALFLGLCLGVGSFALGFTLFLDFLFYKKLTFTPLNFVRFNLVVDSGRYFGAYPWHYYLLEGPAVVLLTFYPFFALGVKFWLQTLYRLASEGYARMVNKTGKKGVQALGNAKYFLIYFVSRDDGPALLGALCSLLLLSFASHKEYRFMMPTLPILLIYVGIGMFCFLSGSNQLHTTLRGQLRSSDALDLRHGKAQRYLGKHAQKRRKAILFVVFTAQLLFAVYLGFFHRRGAPQVMRYLRHLPEGSSIFFLSPAHELPYYSQVHRKFPMGFLDCSPRLRREKNFPPNWQTRFWAPIYNPFNVELLETMFISPSIPQQILVSPPVPSEARPYSRTASQSPFGSTSSGPVLAQTLADVVAPTSRRYITAHTALQPPRSSHSSANQPFLFYAGLREKMQESATTVRLASQLRMSSDVYSKVPEERGEQPFSFIQILFGAWKDKEQERHRVQGTNRGKTEEGKQNVSIFGSMDSARTDEGAVSFSAVENAWFGDAVKHRKKLCRVPPWSHSKNCEVNPSFDECLDYRFLVPLKGQLPTHFVVTSGVYEQIPEWFSSRGYIVKYGPIFDSLVAESPRGNVFWQYFYVLERKPRAPLVLLA